ncbi:MAG: glycosyl hydrolase, partial [Acidobacteria bacterium]|nr:glycosyl hydrolase [Acidobacteriota bacterium]
MLNPPAPLFRDPIHDGAADPTVIWNRQEGAWWLLYTSRRANVPCRGVAWAHGTDIGIASSADCGRHWRYRGTLAGLEFEPGRNTFWAPEVIYCDDLYHLYVSYVRGVPQDWSGPRAIVHLTSEDLWRWQYQSTLSLSSDRVIDAALHRMPAGHWRMWYKDEVKGSYTWAAESDDLYNWSVQGPVITDCAHEGPNVFRWRGSYWLIIDHWAGLGVYQSPDAENWRRCPNILDAPGKRSDDGAIGGHADVLVNGERAFIFYFTHPDWDREQAYGLDDIHPLAVKRTALQ